MIDVNASRASTLSIPVDPYVQEGYRYKALAWLRVKHRLGTVNEAIDDHIARANELSGMTPERSRALLSDAPPSWTSDETGYLCWNLPQYSLAQSKTYNPVHGDLRREYPPIESQVARRARSATSRLSLRSRFEMERRHRSCPVPSAWSACLDGGAAWPSRVSPGRQPAVAMLIVDRVNITDDSGVSQYKLDSDGKISNEMVFEAVVPPGRPDLLERSARVALRNGHRDCRSGCQWRSWLSGHRDPQRQGAARARSHGTNSRPLQGVSEIVNTPLVALPLDSGRATVCRSPDAASGSLR